MKRSLSNVLVIGGAVIMVAAFIVAKVFPAPRLRSTLWEDFLPAWMEAIGGTFLVAGLSFKLISPRGRGFAVKLTSKDTSGPDNGVNDSELQIITLVQKALDSHQPKDYRMTVVRDAIIRNDDTWYVVVEPSREDVQSYDFNARLAEAAAELWDLKDVKIQLTTVLPQHAD